MRLRFLLGLEVSHSSMSLLSHKWWDSCNFFGGMRILGAQLSTPQAPRICENDSWCLQLHASASSAFSKPNAGRKPQVVLCTLGVFISIQGISRRQPSLVSSSLTILCHTPHPGCVQLPSSPFVALSLTRFLTTCLRSLSILGDTSGNSLGPATSLVTRRSENFGDRRRRSESIKMDILSLSYFQPSRCTLVT